MNLQATVNSAANRAATKGIFRSCLTGIATVTVLAALHGVAFAQEAAPAATEANLGPIEFFNAGGFVMWPLLIISLTAIAVIVERFLAYGTLANTASGLVPSVIQKIRGGDFQGALGLAGQQQGPVADVVTTLVQNRTDPKDLLEARAEEIVMAYELKLEKFMWLLDSATTLSPLLGLLGTIIGMVRVFQKFGSAGQSEADKAQVLGGVGESLYATATGIFVALICFGFYNYFVARRRSAVGETEQAATRVITAIEETNRKTVPVR
ncbi:MAG: MotA/TolQ/ExbB proton channel family protein [Armatimonadetes bacterium]|nr:MotA/TolQ/ExbB proton channel family protein [Armatimonadota bacterium]